MRNYLLLFFWVSLLLSSCRSSEPKLGVASNYFPATKVLQAGMVNKFYSHNSNYETKDIKTTIDYYSYQLIADTLHSNLYEPDYKPYIKRKFIFQKDKMLLLEEIRTGRYNDTFNVDLKKMVVKNWSSQQNQSEKTIHYPWGTRTYIIHQDEVKDTLVMNKMAKIFTGRQDNITVIKGDTTFLPQKYQEIYVEDIGLFSRTVKDSTGKFWMELVEQIPFSTFQKEAAHGLHRVAYIDPSLAIDKDSDFETCNQQNKIFDYYNGQQKLHYVGGKKAIWQIVNAKLVKEKLLNESGYLTFRFIVNCKGETGRFVTEETSLDYQKKKFDAGVTAHLYEIMQDITAWIPTHVREKNVDAYFYLTFKLKNGNLIELLP